MFVIWASLSAYTKFKAPIAKNVPREESLLFRFLLNHDFLYNLARQKRRVSRPVDLYHEFEIPFQQDGHFWLQYGQYLSEIGELPGSLEKLRLSIAAYPDNQYAGHAYAAMQLRVASQLNHADPRISVLMSEAVTTLEGQHANRDTSRSVYPIVTLSELYVPLLDKLGRTNEAKAAARRYFDELERLFKAQNGPNENVDNARTSMAKYVTTGQFQFNRMVRRSKDKHS
jgi:tetratricopeptide (TPR) repeat protein